MKSHRKFKLSTVAISLDDLEKMQTLADHMGTTKKDVFHQFIAMLWELGATYEQFNIEYTYYRNTCTVSVTGKNRVNILGAGSLPAEKLGEIYKAFGYSDDGKFTDLRLEKKKEVEK